MKALTEIDNVKHLRGTVVCHASIHHPIGTDGYADDLTQVCLVLLHELDANILLLPQLDETVDRCSDNEVGSISGVYKKNSERIRSKLLTLLH